MRIEHIAIWTMELETSRNFYTEYFGGKAGALYHNPTKEFKSYFITFRSGARLEIMHSPTLASAGNKARIGYAHLAFSVGSKARVDELTNILRERGYTVASEPRTTGDGYYESCILDPDGNQVEITV